MLVYNELPTVFPWYDKLEKQSRYTENAMNTADFSLINPRNALLPFQFKVPLSNTQKPTKWEIMGCDNELAIDISNNIPVLKGKILSDGIYVYYNGESLMFDGISGIVSLDIPSGRYYSRMTFPNNTKYFSEMFFVPNDSFKLGEANNYLRIDFWNTCDIAPIMYQAAPNVFFKQTIYVDSFVHASEPEVEQEGERDAKEQLIPTFQKMVVKYRFTAVVADFVKIALSSLQIHDNVFLTTNKSIRSGQIEHLNAVSAIETGGALSTVDVVMEQTVMVKSACCSNMDTPINPVPSEW